MAARHNPQLTTFDLQPGDVLACWGSDCVSRAVSLGTVSLFAPRRLRLGPSHVAIACRHGRLGTLWVESTTLCETPCRITDRRRFGVQAHYPEDRLVDYRTGGGRVDVYRLSPVDALSQEESQRLTDVLINEFVRPQVTYDFGGALISGTRVVRLLDLALLRRYRTLHEVFCSELIDKVLQLLCRIGRGNPTRSSPARLVRRLVRESTYYFAGELVPPAFLESLPMPALRAA